jgi:hypothetical protein
MSINYNTKIVKDGLVLYLDGGNVKSYPGSGTSCFDLSKSNITGDLQNGVEYSSDNGGTFVFDGTNTFLTSGSTLNDEANGLFAGDNLGWSAFAWFSFPDTSGTQGIMSRGGGTGSSATFVVWKSETAALARLRGGTTLNFIGSNLLFDTWYNIGITYDGTTPKAYLNGDYINDMSIGSASLQNNNFLLGGVGDGTGSSFIGSISSTYVYNRGLTEDEVRQNFNALRGRYGI